MLSEVTIRAAVEKDIESIWKIYSYYIEESVITFRHKIPPLEASLATFHEVTNRRHLPYLVAVHNETVIGYSYVHKYRGNSMGYAPTVELSLFCQPDFCGQGVGSQLLEQLTKQLKGTLHVSHEDHHEDEPVAVEVRHVIAVMSVDETAEGGGLALRDFYVKRGFQQVGYLHGGGYKKGRL